jgi:hypothetical protein
VEFVRRVAEGVRRPPSKLPPLLAAGVLTETRDRFVATFEVLSLQGDLVEVVSASTEVPRSAAPSPALSFSRGAMELLSWSRTPVEAPLLALAPLGPDRIAALTPDAVTLYRLKPSPTLEARQDLPGPLLQVRSPAGVLVSPDEGSLWVFTNRTARADLLSIEGRKASWRGEAQSPPGFPPGLAYRPGTSLLEGPGLGPFLAWLPGPIAVDPEGALLLPDRSSLRSGPALAAFSDRLVIASGARPPSSTDTLSFLERKGSTLVPVDSLAVPGSVRALAASEKRVFLATERLDGSFELWVLDVKAKKP